MKICTELIITTNGVERTKTYDKADRVTSATDSRGGKVDWAYHDKANSKTEKLKEQTVTQGGYTNKVSYDYNTLDQNIRVTDGSQTYRFDYDDLGNVRTYTAGNFVYDPINQLVNEALPNGTSKSYTYDGFGNRTSVKVIENGKETKSIEATF
ncbi:RHS repeat protein [Bacillus pacificus]|nr:MULTISPECIES: RHS repeat domain-containing protein [Bacillus cereus group]MDA1572586.1 RHS repeat protein [Bacillus cereus group sp. TH242-3LC]MED1583604.1 RHS repeat protein [Bacillus pacificus]